MIYKYIFLSHLTAKAVITSSRSACLAVKSPATAKVVGTD